MDGLPAGVAASTARLDLEGAARDLWPRDTLAVRDHGPLAVPAAVVWPSTDAEVEAVFAAAAAAGRSVVPWGAGSGVCGGARGQSGAWTMDLKRFDRIGDVDPASWTVEVGAGVNGQILEDALAARGWSVGHSPSSIGCSTVGGWAAARGAGQFSSAYGVFEDMVVGLDGVSPGIGRWFAGLAGPDSAGVDLGDDGLSAWIGSEGTLGAITRLRLRVRPVAETRVLRGWRFPDVATATDAMRAVMQGELWPCVVRLYDPVDTLIGGRTRPKDAAHEGGNRSWLKGVIAAAERAAPDVASHSLALPLSLPRVLAGLADGLASGCLLIVGWEGSREVVRVAEAAARPILARHGRDLGPEPGERWYASRHAVSYKMMPILLRGGFVDTMEVSAPWSAIPRTWQAVREAVRPHALVMAHFSHAYAEGGTIYFSFAGRGDLARYDAAWSAALAAVRAQGASVSHHHGVGVLKAEAASRSVGPAVAGWRAWRTRFDPAGMCNPGVLFDPDTAVGPSPPPAQTVRDDGLVAVPRGVSPASLDAEVRWPWDRWGTPPRALRNPWESGWIGVRGTVDGVACALGRGPREAVGPDLRPWLAAHAADAQAWYGLAHEGPRWMGSMVLPAPWDAVRRLLRAGLRPGAVGVVDGTLFLGFRGPAAAEFGALAQRVVGPLQPVPWRRLPRYAGSAVPCEPDDPRAVAATEGFVWRPTDEVVAAPPAAEGV